MRAFAGLFVGVLVAAVATTASAAMVATPAPRPAATPVTPVEYYCSPGFEPRGGACVAVPSRAEIELYVDQPIYDAPPTYRRHRRHHRRGLRERF